MASAYALPAIDVSGKTWKLLREQLKQHVEGYRTELESSTCTPENTALLRGRIKELRLILALEKDPVNRATATALANEDD